MFPHPVPAIARSEPAHDARLRHLQKLDAALAGPATHAAVAGVRHARAGLFVGHEELEARLAAEPLKHLHRLAAAGDEPYAELPEGGLHVSKALALELRVTRVPLRLREHLRLIDKHRKYGSASSAGTGLGERSMIAAAQVALQPYAHRRRGITHHVTIRHTGHSLP